MSRKEIVINIKSCSAKVAGLLIFLFSLQACKADRSLINNEMWWKESVFYEIYMPSYKDGNGDGFSDFKGLTAKLDYIEDLGVKGIWLTPFLKSPKVDNGYDVANYYEIDTSYGKMADFKVFLNEAHKRDIKVIMDMVVNHTSTESKWFQEAKKSKDNPFRDYYVWKDSPNNWESFFGGSAWKYDSVSQQYYYHQFDEKMADLNWENPKVVEEVQDVLRFWLELGVDGFRMDVINFLTTNVNAKDNPYKDGKQQHLYDKDQAGIKDAMRAIKATINEYPNRFVVGEVGSDKIEELKKYQAEDLMDVVFNFNFGSLKEFSAERIYEELESMHKNMPGFPTLFFGSHDMPRLRDRLAANNPARAEALAALMLTARGIPFIYYGEELGMNNIQADSLEEIRDIQALTHYNLTLENGGTAKQALKIGNEHNRDKSRSPMQWTDEKFAGFSNKSPWIKVHKNYTTLNVQSQAEQENSLLNNYKKLIELRNSQPVLQYGKYEDLNLKDSCISFTREYRDEIIKCYFNFADSPIEIEVSSKDKILRGKNIVAPSNYLIVKTK
ncbi:alpha-glucosidase [Gillisia sp. M10.2A]|uniref:Alpha-glucosidase n=1 Tax=Gillisia lutea TaxID=2909668 RepID=A0ABS9EHS9_9FLAO|nr:alpha-glucosidase [Gillisia lutea]MCF4101399.1 alpha-glucosidase [Gillisia lutea]